MGVAMERPVPQLSARRSASPVHSGAGACLLGAVLGAHPWPLQPPLLPTPVLSCLMPGRPLGLSLPSLGSHAGIWSLGSC